MVTTNMNNKFTTTITCTMMQSTLKSHYPECQQFNTLQHKNTPKYTWGLPSSLTTDTYAYTFTCTTLFDMKHISALYFQYTKINCNVQYRLAQWENNDKFNIWYVPTL